MQPFTILRGVAAPLMRGNIDTDALISAQGMMSGMSRLGEKLFTNWRYRADGAENPDFVLNDPRYRNSLVLVAGRNFGCGSSREAAVWALLHYGIRCVVAPSFGEIFEDNAYQNGLLPVTLDEVQVLRIARALREAVQPVLTVDLTQCRITLPEQSTLAFEISAERREAMMQGMDDLDFLLAQSASTASFQQRDRVARPWIHAAPENA